MVGIAGHGGGCCGIRTLQSMGNHPTSAHGSSGRTYAQELEFQVRGFESGNRMPRLLEIVLIDSQENNGWPAELQRQGWRKAVRFLNGNTGNHCNIWHRHRDALGIQPDNYQVFDPTTDATQVRLQPEPNRRVLYRHPTDPGHRWHLRVGTVESTTASHSRVRWDNPSNINTPVETVSSARLFPSNEAAVPPPPAAPLANPFGNTPTTTPLPNYDITTRPRDIPVGTRVQLNDTTYAGNAGRFNLRFGIVTGYGFGTIDVLFEGQTGLYEGIYPHRFRPAPLAAPVTTPRPEVRIILTEYVAVLRTIGRRGPFSAIQEAREAYPRCRSFERRDVSSDGTVTWTGVE